MNERQHSADLRKPWFGKTLAAAVLAFAMVPGSAFALATYDAGALLQMSATPEDGIVFLGGSVDLDNTSDTGAGTFTVFANSFVSADPDVAVTDQDVRVIGGASPTAAGSLSSALAENSASMTFLNTTNQDLSVIVNYFYLADATTSLTDPLLEAVGASVSIAIGTALGGDQVTAAIDLLGPGQDSLSDASFIELIIPAGGFDGVYGDLFAEGIAISQSPDAQVPLPATLALLGLGLLGLNAQRRRLNAHA